MFPTMPFSIQEELNMKNLEELLNKYLKSGNVSDLPDIAQDSFLRVNSIDDGFHRVKRGGHLYYIEKTGNDYCIYGVRLSPARTNKVGVKHDPRKVGVFYLDDAPVVRTIGEEIYYDARDTKSLYNIARATAKYQKLGTHDKLYDVLSAFRNYAYSVFQFTTAYQHLLTPPIEIGNEKGAEQPAQGQGSQSSQGSESSQGTQTSEGSQSSSSGSNPSDTGGNSSEANG